MEERIQTRTEFRYNGEVIVTRWAPTGNDEQPWRPIDGAILNRQDKVLRQLTPQELSI